MRYPLLLLSLPWLLSACARPICPPHWRVHIYPPGNQLQHKLRSSTHPKDPLVTLRVHKHVQHLNTLLYSPSGNHYQLQYIVDIQGPKIKQHITRTLITHVPPTQSIEQIGVTDRFWEQLSTETAQIIETILSKAYCPRINKRSNSDNDQIK